MSEGRRSRRTIALALLLAFAVIIPGGSPYSQATSEEQATTRIEFEGSYRALSIAAAKRPPVFAKSILLMDAETGELLWSQNPDEVLPVASTTKMTTALVARESLRLDDVVTVPKRAVLVPGSKIQLKTGERITVRDLVKGLLIQSGNDAAYTLASYYGSLHGGDEKLFIEKMNQFTRRHNLNSTYNDPAGLDDDLGRATARELAHTARLVLADPILAKIVTTANETIQSIDGTITHDLKNSNRLVQSDSPYYLPTALGIKTGFTPTAGHCLVAAYESRYGKIIGVVLNTNEYTVTASSSEMRKLFVWAEQNIQRTSY